MRSPRATACSAPPSIRCCLARLDLKPGARITIGAATIEIRAALTAEPDRLSAGGFGLGPRLMISPDALRATGLLQPGSQVRWHYRLRLADNDASDAAVQRTINAASAQVPDAGWEVRSRNNASPGLERNIERFTQYLTLVGLTALLVGGVGVANAIRGHLDRKRDTIATMKTLGATGGSVFTVYLTQTMALAFIGAIPGLILGAALPFLIAWGFGSILPLPLAPTLHPEDLALALLYGLLTALAFAIWPLGRAHDVSVSALFRDEVAPERHWPRTIYVVLTVVAVATLAVLAVKLAYDQRIAAIFVVAAAGVFVSLRLVASLVMAVAKRVPRPRSTALRLAIANIHRPGALTSSVVMSLGLGLALLVTVIEVDGNLRRQFIAALPEQAPSFFFLDIQSADAERFDAFIRQHAPGATFERVPMLRGRIVSANGVRAEDIRVPASQNWVLQSDRGITYSDTIPAGSRVVQGAWWPPDYSGPPLVSFESRVAGALGLKLGDTIVVNVLGRNIEARVANLRTLDWQSLGINFAMVFAPASLRGAPHTFIATLSYPGGSTVAQETALAEGRRRHLPGDHDGAGARGGRLRRRPDRQPGGGAARRQRAHAADRRARARWRTGSGTPPSRLRRGRAQDRGRHARQAARRLRPRIPDARRRHRGVRRGGRHRRCRVRDPPGDEPALHLVTGPRPCRRRRRHRRHRGARPDRHLPRARSEAGAGAAEPVKAGKFCGSYRRNSPGFAGRDARLRRPSQNKLTKMQLTSGLPML